MPPLRQRLAELLPASDSPADREFWAELEAWLADEPVGERERLRTDLESNDDARFYAAACEVFLTHQFASRGWEFERHPQIEGVSTTPDYLIHHPAQEFYVEATVAFESTIQQTQSRLLGQLVDALRPIQGPFSVHMLLETLIPGGFSRRRIQNFLRDSLAGLSSGQSSSFLYFDPATAFRVRFDVLPSEDEGEVIAVLYQGPGRPEAVEITTHEGILRAVDDKGSHYGHLNAPLVIVVKPMLRFPATTVSIHRALFGRRSVAIASTAEGPSHVGDTYSRTGLFSRRGEDGSPTRTRVSAVGIYKHRMTFETNEHHLAIFHHPHAGSPLNGGVFAEVPQLFATAESADRLSLEWRPEVPDWLA